MQELHGLRAVPSQHVVLALTPHAFAHNICKTFTGSYGQYTRNDAWARVQQLRWLAVLKS
eukprot:5922759-Pyramimonas_sp.AAC.1